MSPWPAMPVLRLPPVARSVLRVPGAAITPARDALGGVVRALLTDRGRAPVDLEFASLDDPGLFGPESVAWRVHADRSMLVGGIRALLLQVMHPLTMAGVAQHSSYRQDPLGRLARTGRFITATTYGSTREAEASIAMVRSVHERVRGVAADGRPYDATDPALLAWVHNVEVESFLEAYLRYGPGLDADDADRYVGEMAVIGRRLGAVDVPETASELSDWIAAVPELAMTREAREAVRFLVFPPLPPAVLPAYFVLAAAAAGLLPLGRRLALGLWPVPFVDPLVVRPATATLLGALDWALGPPPTPVFEAA